MAVNVASIARSPTKSIYSSSIWQSALTHRCHLSAAVRHKCASKDVQRCGFCSISTSAVKISATHSANWSAAWMSIKAKCVAVMILKRISMKKNAPNGIWRANHVSLQRKPLFLLLLVVVVVENLCFMFSFEFWILRLASMNFVFLSLFGSPTYERTSSISYWHYSYLYICLHLLFFCSIIVFSHFISFRSVLKAILFTFIFLYLLLKHVENYLFV